ncbi:hypothetical protein [Mycobacterium sp.]|uniref:hypothetical protein n=1 Tax=Mycobacterium sp. TaxID=1785 RepID=UPI0031CF23F3
MTTAPTTPDAALSSLHACRDHLLQAVLDASHAAALLDASRAVRARELVTLLDAAISHAGRLATAPAG